MPAEPTVQAHAYMDRREYLAAKWLADRAGLSFSRFVRQAIAAHVQKTVADLALSSEELEEMLDDIQRAL